MVQKVMICGRECQPDAANCNNYCNYDKSKPMADHPPLATPEMQLASARRIAYEKLHEAAKAWHEYFAMCEVGPERERAAQAYENVRNADWVRRFYNGESSRDIAMSESVSQRRVEQVLSQAGATAEQRNLSLF